MITGLAKRRPLGSALDRATRAGKAVSGPLWPFLRQGQAQGTTMPATEPTEPRAGRLIRLALAALMTGSLALAQPAPAMAQTDPTPQLGMPGFAKGFEGFFNDDGMRTADDDRAQPTPLRSSRSSWTCVFPFEELAALTVTIDGLTLNNFSLREDIGVLSRRPYAELSFSLVNRSPKPRLPTVQFIAYDTTSPLPALAFSAGPILDIIDARTTDQITASVNILAGEFQTLRRFCVRIDG